MRISAWLSLLVASLSTMACASLSASSPARHGDLPALRQALDEDFRAGRLDRDAVVELARDVATHELKIATGKLAIARINELRMCTSSVADAMQDRAEGSDEAAALAAMALLEAHKADPDDWRGHASDETPAWRAVGTRALVGEHDGGMRRARMLDPDESVRLAAVRAAEDAADPADAAALLDAARKDPNQLVRVQALRSIAASAGSSDTVLALKDLWPQGSEAIRQAIVAAWAWPGMFEKGGIREIVWAAESEAGSCSIVAGGILLRQGGEQRGAGLAAITRAVQTGIARDRALAINMAPLDDPRVVELIQAASKEAEPAVKVAALERLARDPAYRAAALQTLGQVAVSKSAPAPLARAAMARLGDARVTALLLEDGKSTKPQERLSAGQSLADLGDWGRAAQFLADPDVDVRTRIACRLMIAVP